MASQNNLKFIMNTLTSQSKIHLKQLELISLDKIHS